MGLAKPLNKEQQADFVRKWYGCQERYGRSQSKANATAVAAIANEKADDLLQQIERREELQAMATNPLLLNMIAPFHRFYPGSELPRKRAELYQEICRLQLGERPQARQIDMLLSPEHGQRVLQSLALEMTRREVEIIAYTEIWIEVGGKLDFANAVKAAKEAYQKLGDVVSWRGDGINFDAPLLIFKASSDPIPGTRSIFLLLWVRQTPKHHLTPQNFR